jgi:hypothetical protein
MNNKLTIQQPVAKVVVFPDNDFNRADVVNIDHDQPLPNVGDIVEYDQYNNHDLQQQPIKTTAVVKLVQKY